MAKTGNSKRKNQRRRKTVKIPLSWRALALAGAAAFGLAIFYFGLRHAGVKLPISEKDRDSIFFSFIFAVAIPAFLYAIAEAVMRDILLKKSSGDIAKEIAKDVAASVAVAALDVVIGADNSQDSRSGSSSSGGASGGGGDFGGGGASGSY